MSLSYTRSRIYPDESIVEWRPRESHDGFVKGKLKFRVFIQENNDCELQFFNEDHCWEHIASFHHATVWCWWIEMDPAWAEQYEHYLALHKCHSLAERITKERIFKHEHQSTAV